MEMKHKTVSKEDLVDLLYKQSGDDVNITLALPDGRSYNFGAKMFPPAPFSYYMGLLIVTDGTLTKQKGCKE